MQESRRPIVTFTIIRNLKNKFTSTQKATQYMARKNSSTNLTQRLDQQTH